MGKPNVFSNFDIEGSSSRVPTMQNVSFHPHQMMFVHRWASLWVWVVAIFVWEVRILIFFGAWFLCAPDNYPSARCSDRAANEWLWRDGVIWCRTFCVQLCVLPIATPLCSLWEQKHIRACAFVYNDWWGTSITICGSSTACIGFQTALTLGLSDHFWHDKKFVILQ